MVKCMKIAHTNWKKPYRSYICNYWGSSDLRQSNLAFERYIFVTFTKKIYSAPQWIVVNKNFPYKDHLKKKVSSQIAHQNSFIFVWKLTTGNFNATVWTHRSSSGWTIDSILGNMLAACQRFKMVRISDNGPGWK